MCSNTTQKTLLKEKKCHFCSNIIPWLSPICGTDAKSLLGALCCCQKPEENTHSTLRQRTTSESLPPRNKSSLNCNSNFLPTNNTIWIDSNWFHVSFRSRKLQCVSPELYQCLHNHFLSFNFNIIIFLETPQNFVSWHALLYILRLTIQKKSKSLTI